MNENCDICQRNMQKPGSIRVSLFSQEIVFNLPFCVYLMFLRSRALFHTVDQDTRFSAAAFLKKTAEDNWRNFVSKLVFLYILYPLNITSDQRPQFVSKIWTGYLKNSGINNLVSGVEIHNSISVYEMYHSYLSKLFNKISDDFPGLPQEDVLDISILAMNDKVRQILLVPKNLFFCGSL